MDCDRRGGSGRVAADVVALGFHIGVTRPPLRGAEAGSRVVLVVSSGVPWVTHLEILF
jgi:hypothetical protein